MQVLVAFFLERGQRCLVEEIGKMVFAMFIEVFFREGYDLGVVLVVEADSQPGRGRITGNLHESDLGRVKHLLHIVAYLVYFALGCHFPPLFN